MLTDKDLLLISAAVEGDLPVADERRFRSLLADKSEAVRVYRQLRDTAARLNALARCPAPAAILSNVLGRLPTAVPARPTPARRNVWLPYAVAATLLFTLTSASFWYFTAQQQSDTAARQRRALPAESTPPAELPHLPFVNPPHEDTRVADLLPPPREVPREVAVVPPPETAPSPRPQGGDFVGAGIAEQSKPLQTVELKLPFVAGLADFLRDDAKSRLSKEFAGEPAVRIDLFARNLSAATDALALAAKANGVALVVDGATQERITKKQAFPFAMLVEGLTPEELASLLESLAKGVAGVAQPPISSVHVFPAGPVEQKDWKELFGGDLGVFKSNRPNAQPPLSPSRPISEGTIGKVKSVVGKNAEKSALLLTYLPRGQQLSKEVKAYLDGRGERKAGTLPAVIVVRPTN